MATQKIIWTVLPKGFTRDGEPIVSLVPSFRLTPQTANEQVLEAFPDLLDWPAQLRRTRFALRVGGQSFDLKPLSDPDSDTWQRVFPKDLPVAGYVFNDLSVHNLRSFPVRSVVSFLHTHYGELAENEGLQRPPLFGTGSRLQRMLGEIGIRPGRQRIGISRWFSDGRTKRRRQDLHRIEPRRGLLQRAGLRAADRDRHRRQATGQLDELHQRSQADTRTAGEPVGGRGGALLGRAGVRALPGEPLLPAARERARLRAASRCRRDERADQGAGVRFPPRRRKLHRRTRADAQARPRDRRRRQRRTCARRAGAGATAAGAQGHDAIEGRACAAAAGTHRREHARDRVHAHARPIHLRHAHATPSRRPAAAVGRAADRQPAERVQGARPRLRTHRGRPRRRGAEDGRLRVDDGGPPVEGLESVRRRHPLEGGRTHLHDEPRRDRRRVALGRHHDRRARPREQRGRRPDRVAPEARCRRAATRRQDRLLRRGRAARLPHRRLHRTDGAVAVAVPAHRRIRLGVRRRPGPAGCEGRGLPLGRVDDHQAARRVAAERDAGPLPARGAREMDRLEPRRAAPRAAHPAVPRQQHAERRARQARVDPGRARRRTERRRHACGWHAGHALGERPTRQPAAAALQHGVSLPRAARRSGRQQP